MRLGRLAITLCDEDWRLVVEALETATEIYAYSSDERSNRFWWVRNEVKSILEKKGRMRT